MVETVNQEDVVVPKENMRPWTARVAPNADEFSAKEVPVSRQFILGDFLKNHSER
jgi:hypothetical protein